jgi:ubiquinone/menaquinone biosynthesis C-methylase UbiE
MKFICPRCRAGLNQNSERELFCSHDGLTFKQQDGVWRFLLPERESYYARFITDYETVRCFEGRGSPDPAYYRALPFHDLSGKFSADWRIRLASFQALTSRVIQPYPQTIVDIGAGNGWLSNQLSKLAHQVYAVDLLINSEDGLGAWTYYETQFTPLQSEFTRLPIPDSSIDVVIFNASFHYSENYEVTLQESLRILSPRGRVLIMDSPIYHDDRSGEQMAAERRAEFLRKYGVASDSIKSENYLTYSRMNALSKALNIRWHQIIPFYGLRWKLRPWLARLRKSREPAEFGLWVGER